MVSFIGRETSRNVHTDCTQNLTYSDGLLVQIVDLN